MSLKMNYKTLKRKKDCYAILPDTCGIFGAL